MTEVCILIARQRSGTGALGSALDQWPDVSYLGEVFHPDHAGSKGNYFTHLLEQVTADPKNCLPEARDKVLLSFIARLSESAKKNHIIVDVKYSSAHHFEGAWHSPLATPALLLLAKQSGWKIIHLTRKNHLAVFISGAIAEENSVWHTTDAEQVRIKQVTVDIGKLLRFLELAASEDAFFAKSIAKSQRTLSIDYSELFTEDGGISEKVTKKIADLFKTDPGYGKAPVFIKQAPTAMPDAIINFEDVRTALSKTRFAWMIEGA